MACILLDNERRSDLWAEHQPSWMKYIFARMSAPFEEFQNNNITFVTFNYDRSLEHFFHTALKATYGKSDDECAETLKHIPVVHLHGRLGILPWQESSNIVTYGQALDAKTMEVCIRNIKVVHEDPADGRDAEFTRAKEALHQAERIFFLGFGFGERNVGRLGLAQLPDNRAAGTAYQLTSAEVQYISALCNNRVHLINNDCLNFCRGIAIWS
jgi:hypothetical protein